jgi:hypothetical protein
MAQPSSTPSIRSSKGHRQEELDVDGQIDEAFARPTATDNATHIEPDTHIANRAQGILPRARGHARERSAITTTELPI